MNYQEYAKTSQYAAQLVEQGEYEKAISIFQELLILDILDFDKAMVCFNIAQVNDKLERVEEALFWYDKGMRYERGNGRYFVAERKAGYLAVKGRYQESLDHYKDLRRRSELTEADKTRIETNIMILEKRI